jgi:putative endonuclease
MAPVSSTGSPFLGLRNTSQNKLRSQEKSKMFWAHQRGLKAEAAAINHYQKQNYQLIHQRLQTPFAEVDLFFKTPEGHFLLVEVKSVNLSSFYNTRISKKQKSRLERAVLFLSHKYEALIEVHWAFVGFNDAVVVFKDVCG